MSYTPLTEKQIDEVLGPWAFKNLNARPYCYEAARAIEAKATAPLLARIGLLLEKLREADEHQDELQADNERLRAALAEASKDVDRLDWLDEQNADLGNEAWCVLGHDCAADEDFRKFWVGSDLRGAIDDAMKGMR